MRVREAAKFFALHWVFLLLVAQQGALTHAIWHAHKHSPLHAQHADHESHDRDDRGDGSSPQSELCGFDLAFGQVLGGVHGNCLHFIAGRPDAERAAQLLRARLSVEPVPFYSRGPPVLS